MFSFLHRYQKEFGFTLENKKVLVDDIRVRGVGVVMNNIEEDIEQAVNPPVVDKVCVSIPNNDLINLLPNLLMIFSFLFSTGNSSLLRNRLSQNENLFAKKFKIRAYNQWSCNYNG